MKALLPDATGNDRAGAARTRPVARGLLGLSALICMTVAPVPAVAETKDFDGEWTGELLCADDWRSLPIQVNIQNGDVKFRRSSSEGSTELDGRIAADGSLALSGLLRRRGYDLVVKLQGKAEAEQMSGTGSRIPTTAQGGRIASCSIALKATTPHPESLHGRQLAALKPPGAGASAATAPGVASACAIDVAPIRTASATPGTAFDARPKLYVLSVGVSRYAEATMNLGFAAKDACDMARALAGQQGGLYRQVEIRVVQDENATRDGVLDGLDWIVRQTTARDVAMVFLAGHGVNDATGEYFFLPHDANLDRLARTAIPQSDIRRGLMQVAGKALFFFDTCHSGQIMASRRALPPNINDFVAALTTAENSVVVFSASTGRQFAIEDASWGNGAFTKALLEGLGGQADYRRDKVVTVNELDVYLSERVKELTGGRQSPTTAKPASTQDFPIAVVR